MATFRAVPDPGLPPFFGGFVGYLAYDNVAFFEKIQIENPDDLDVPDCLFVLADSLIVFDRVKHTILIVANALVEDDPRWAYETALARISEIEARLSSPKLPPRLGAAARSLSRWWITAAKKITAGQSFRQVNISAPEMLSRSFFPCGARWKSIPARWICIGPCAA
ncbi:MAG: Anthranilate synthase component 1 [Candidatus Hinthialibacteria bacterium OLB16]|nr:MAG: Anthranilate synthase component 1 [Candidatus Hinthialibacteria bacterium OLB16]